MGVTFWNGYPHDVSVLRDDGIERVLTYHPIHQPVPNLTYIDEFIEEPCGGIYLKWLGKKSNYEYHLFNREYEQILKTQDRGNILNTDTNRARALSATHNIGKVATVSLRLTTTFKKEDRAIKEFVLISPEVYLYNPESILSTVSCSPFIKVFVSPGSFIIERGNSNTVKLKFTIEFDPKNVQSII